MLIELAQLVSFRGLFEFDDVIHNALGTAVGVLLALGMKWLVKKTGLLPECNAMIPLVIPPVKLLTGIDCAANSPLKKRRQCVKVIFSIFPAEKGAESSHAKHYRRVQRENPCDHRRDGIVRVHGA